MPTIVQNLGAQLVRMGSRLLGRPLMQGGRNVFNISSPEVYADIDSKNAIEKGFNKNIAVYSIAMKDAEKFGSIPRYLYAVDDKKSGKREKFEKSKDLNQLLNQPNKSQSQDSFLTLARAFYKVTGETFIWLNRGDLENYRNADGTLQDDAIDLLPVLEMQVLPSNLVALIPDPDDPWGVIAYILQAGTEVVIRKNDIIHWKSTTLEFDIASRSHMRGFTPLTPGALTLEESNSVSKASMRAAQNDGSKAVIFDKSLKASMTPTQQSDLKRVIDSKINNNNVADSVATLQGDWGLLDLSQTAKDQMHIEKKEATWRELCFLMKVPYEFFDSKTTFANKEQAQVGWITNDIIPACKQFDGEMNRVLLKAFGLVNKAYIGTDYSELPEIQKAMAETAKTMQDIWSLSPDDVRRFLGFEPYGGTFDEPWVTSGRTPLSIATMTDGSEDIATELEQNRLNDGRGAGSNDQIS